MALSETRNQDSMKTNDPTLFFWVFIQNSKKFSIDENINS